jgi:hypothetical protein
VRVEIEGRVIGERRGRDPERRPDDALPESRDRGERSGQDRLDAVLVRRMLEDREVAEVGPKRGVLLDQPHDRFGVRHAHAGETLPPGRGNDRGRAAGQTSVGIARDRYPAGQGVMR